MGRKNFAGVIDVQGNADVDGVCVESYLARMINKSILAEHIVAVNPCGEITGCSLQSAIDRIALSGIRLANPVSEPSRISFNDLDGIIGAAAVED